MLFYPTNQMAIGSQLLQRCLLRSIQSDSIWIERSSHGKPFLVVRNTLLHLIHRIMEVLLPFCTVFLTTMIRLCWQYPVCTIRSSE